MRCPRPDADPPRVFAAYLNTLRWNCITATDPRLFQSPYQAGIKLEAFQLEPLRKGLLLPRQLPLFYAASDIVTMPSHYESFGMAALEGMHRCAPTPGHCSLVRVRSYAPEYTRCGVSDWPMSNTRQPLMSRITAGGGVKLGGGCVWVRIAPQAPFILAKSRAEQGDWLRLAFVSAEAAGSGCAVETMKSVAPLNLLRPDGALCLVEPQTDRVRRCCV